MPEILLSGNDRHDSLLVQAVMLWPDESQEDRRSQFCAANEAFHIIKSGQSEVTVPIALLDVLLDTPSWQSLKSECITRTKRAFLAGHVLSSFFVSHLIDCAVGPEAGRKKRTTLSMAFDGAVHWALNMGAYGDGIFLPTDRRKWEESFSEFRSVSHIYAAKELAPNFMDIAPADCMKGEALYQTLALATTLQDFGAQFAMDKRSRNGSPYLLPSTETWTIVGNSVPPLSLSAADQASILETDYARFVAERIFTGSAQSVR